VSQQNVELHRRFYAAFNVHDIEAIIALCHPSVEFHSRFAAVSGLSVYRGHDGMRKWNRDFEEVWGDEIRVHPEAYFDLGDQTLAFAEARGRGQHSRIETAMQLAQVAAWRDGLMLALKSHAGREEALRDLGLSEDALDPIAP
jgi:ketosteroid isomerase-like protein